MHDSTPDIIILEAPIGAAALRTLVQRFFIRPAAGNPSMEVEDADLRARLRELTLQFIGRGASIS